MIDAKRVLNIYLNLNAHNWELPGAIIGWELQQGWLDLFPWVLRTVERNEAQHSDDAILISKGTILFSTQEVELNTEDAEKWKKPGVSMAPKWQHAAIDVASA
jgi:hypothetical protein